MARLSSWLRAGARLHREGRICEAGQIYRKVLTLDPENAVAFYLLGLAALRAESIEESAALIAQSLAIEPTRDGCLLLAILFDRQQRRPAALAWYRKAHEFKAQTDAST